MEKKNKTIEDSETYGELNKKSKISSEKTSENKRQKIVRQIMEDNSNIKVLSRNPRTDKQKT